jgi:hypothetical protein
MNNFPSVTRSAFLALVAWIAMINPLRAESGTVRVVFGTAGLSRVSVTERAF